VTKEKYRGIRNKPNFLFLYYLEHNGKIKLEDTFKNTLNMWLLINYGLGIRPGSVIICKFLDIKYQFI